MKTNQNVREKLIKTGVIHAGAKQPETAEDLKALRAKGRKVCSQIEAVLARRASFKGH